MSNNVIASNGKKACLEITSGEQLQLLLANIMQHRNQDELDHKSMFLKDVDLFYKLHVLELSLFVFFWGGGCCFVVVF